MVEGQEREEKLKGEISELKRDLAKSGILNIYIYEMRARGRGGGGSEGVRE